MSSLDTVDRAILAELDRDPRATVQLLAERLHLARGTVHARLDRLAANDVLLPHSLRIRTGALGLPMRAFVQAEVDQSEFGGLVVAMAAIPEVIECAAVSGGSDLLIEIAARDAEHVYEITQRIMGCRGIRRTATSIVLKQLLPARVAQLLPTGG